MYELAINEYLSTAKGANTKIKIYTGTHCHLTTKNDASLEA